MVICAPRLVITKAVSSSVFGAKIRECGGEHWEFSLLLRVTLCPFEMPRTVLVDTETGEGANFWEVKRDLTRNVTSQRQENNLSGFEVPWLGLALGLCQPRSSSWLV